MINVKTLSQCIQLFIVIILFISCGSKGEFISPVSEKITESVYASGYVKSKDQYQVFSKANGILKKLQVKKGDEVRKGQVMFVLSNDVSKFNTENAQLAASNADLRSNTDKLRELDLTIELSKKKMENDKLLLDRQRTLWTDQIGTRFELEQRELAFSNSKSAYESARLRYNELKKQLKFTADQTRKNVSISQSMQDDFTIRSEVNGRVYTILKEEGEMITPQAPIALIGDATQFTLLLQVDENDIVKVKPGQKIAVTMDSYKGQVFEAVVTKINPLMNERSRSFEIEAGFTKQPSTLYPNLTLEANIILQSKENALTIPRKYLINDEYVMISKKEKRKVKIGLKDYQKAEILEGLSKDDKIMMPQQ